MSTTVDAGATIVLDPSDIRVIDFDWDVNLDAGVTITTHTWTITALRQNGAGLLTKANESILSGDRKVRARFDATTASLWDMYEVASKIVTSESPAQTKEQSFKIAIQNR